MKMLLSLAILLTLGLSATANAVDSVRAKECPLAKKKFDKITYEDYFNGAMTSWCSAKEIREISRMFDDIVRIDRGLNTNQISDEKVLSVHEEIDKLSEREHGLLQVGSFVEEVITGKRILITGVGTVFRSIGKSDYKILTAAHVVAGNKPFINIGTKKVAAKIIKVDLEKDLALLSFEQNKESLPLGYFGKGVIVTTFNQDVGGAKSGIFDIFTYMKFDTSRMENIDTRDILLPSSSVPIAPWLAAEFKRNMRPVDYSEFQVPRTKSDTMMIAPGKFPSGFSGSPILVTYRIKPFDAMSVAPDYGMAVGGVLSLSGEKDGKEVTIASSMSQIREFLENPVTSDQSVSWYMVGPYFMKWNSVSKEGVVYANPKPIGNGIVVEGDRVDPLQTESVKDPELAKVAAKLKELKNSGQNFNLNQSIYGLKLKTPVSTEQSMADWKEYSERMGSLSGQKQILNPSFESNKSLKIK